MPGAVDIDRLLVVRLTEAKTISKLRRPPSRRVLCRLCLAKNPFFARVSEREKCESTSCPHAGLR